MMIDPRQEYVRVWLTMMPGTTARTMRLRLSRRAPASGTSVAALLSRGQLAGDSDVEIVVTTGAPIDGAKGDKGDKGDPGDSAYQFARALGYGGTTTQWLATLKGDKGDKGDRGDAGATLLGTVTIAEAATLSIVVAGTRKVTLTTPAAWGVAPGGNFLLFAAGATPAGYVLGDVVATAANTLQVSLIGPLIAIGASFSIPCRLVRINT